MDVQQILQSAAAKGGESLLTFFHKELTLSKKTSHQNLVSQADLASQQVIKSEILSFMIDRGIDEKEIGFIGEENLNSQGKHLFIIDPLDGTNNFASGHDHFGISIAYVFEGVLSAGLIYQPFTNTFYIGELRKGAFKIGPDGEKKEMRIKYTNLENTLVATYLTSSQDALNKLIPVMLRLNKVTRGIRILGSFVLDAALFSNMVNSINVLLHAHPYLWDIAAAKLIIEESGGVMTDWQGNPIQLRLDAPHMNYSILACHPDNLQEILKIIAA
ncbi:hypothetical protein A2334_03315 [Candidatus Roizmanbacteria bacterium RIFOXYB2_FULL_38_10]|uniref:Inositol-phosphate phosphatase n=1 Tax=Candidatus Roizmanbacteria bacterium RIFOXYD1_FULL_38_12 TaxID=1802093 RepID=A0A1F7L125_9BACT|nr:MAG: hypothetical protein A3K47_03530 [Candidatus Roizmanbacteria bacterium RIFOXYA2_FULL_38_14]OGK63834.1 MAG: hypothetical protein A3K27_03530 [Candidatus Roizmanbacteria bacterium RIFOXYA1_FULL_37_12]OGK65680.1 MAG: hypothetical protein A3K38_03530 [Candidatus Roizmanbacteria bacterium RIFOXYB1_FULL_40_23]OGK67432.1 MAG: hypothetical protein A2334_03315 [Candidatus Roizmanbacteria bacterium RIFOXYB2_FULL_38_10]OGK70085.1 MAG: hypothetical protein A3K21_03535 [Candidatus Roizmanbacteria ba